MQLLYPSDPFDPKLPDETYLEEFLAAKDLGLKASTLSFEDFESGIFKVRPALTPGESVIYRGWMLTPEVYGNLVSGLHAKGLSEFTSAESYRLCHHLPQWYPHLSELTSQTIFLSEGANFTEALKGLNWPGYFVKDFVKSLNTGSGSLVERPEQVEDVVQLIRKYRGNIEGGICIRRREEYISGSERRYFVLNGQAHAAIGEAPEIVAQCAARIQSPFFSVDFVLRSDGVLRVVELGDGQVSDRKEWAPERFAQVMRLAG